MKKKSQKVVHKSNFITEAKTEVPKTQKIKNNVGALLRINGQNTTQSVPISAYEVELEMYLGDFKCRKAFAYAIQNCITNLFFNFNSLKNSITFLHFCLSSNTNPYGWKVKPQYLLEQEIQVAIFRQVGRQIGKLFSKSPFPGN